MGTSSTTIGRLGPDGAYRITLNYLYHPTRPVMIGLVKVFPSDTADGSQLPFGLGMWFDATDISGTGNPMSQGMNVITWVDKSSYGRNMNI